MKIPATVQVLTRNSRQGIEPCLESLKDFAEVIVQDGHSTDGTRDVISKFPNVTLMDQNKAYIDHEGRITDFSAIRNESIEAAKHDWIFVIDADEVVTPAQVQEVRAIVEKNEPGVFIAFRRFTVNGEKIMWSAAYPALQIRLFHRSLTNGYRKPVHERLELKPGAQTQMLHEELPVPLLPAKDLRPKYHRYLMMEVKRSHGITIVGWMYWVLLRNIRAMISMTLKLLWVWVIPRKGKRLPLQYEVQFIVHSFKTIVHTFPPMRFLRKWGVNPDELVSYFAMGISALVLNVGTYWVLLRVGIWFVTASVISEVVGFFSAFLLQKYVAFKRQGSIVKHFARYCLLGAWNLFATTAILWIAVDQFGISEIVGKLIAIACVVLWNFFLYKFVVYA